ncbi:MAG: YhbY family RNA-binding protein [Candidatus Woesearchaeota archaeon]
MEKKIKIIRAKSNNIKPKIIIGKDGLNENIIKNIKKIIEHDGFVKIKILKTLIGENDKKKIFQEIAEVSNTKIAYSIGHTIVLTKN